MRFSIMPLLAVLFILSACAGVPPNTPHPYDGYLKQNGLTLPEPDSFDHCRGYGCAARDRVSLTKKEWTKITRHFKKSRDATSERAALSRAIGEFETIIGAKTGTEADIAGTFGKVGTHQHDCIDESINTTIYLAMLEKNGLLKHHVVSRPTSRTPFTSIAGGRLWPHSSAVIFDQKTGTGYAVDSWFRDNGAPADIIPLDAWIAGWGPEEA